MRRNALPYACALTTSFNGMRIDIYSGCIAVIIVAIMANNKMKNMISKNGIYQYATGFAKTFLKGTFCTFCLF